MSEPMSEDDSPDDRIVSFVPFTQGEEKISINYIKKECDKFFKPLNTQIDKIKINKENDM